SGALQGSAQRGIRTIAEDLDWKDSEIPAAGAGQGAVSGEQIAWLVPENSTRRPEQGLRRRNAASRCRLQCCRELRIGVVAGKPKAWRDLSWRRTRQPCDTCVCRATLGDDLRPGRRRQRRLQPVQLRVDGSRESIVADSRAR